MGNSYKYAILTVILALMLAAQSMAQQISAQFTTPAGNCARAGNLSYSYSIGAIGHATVRMQDVKESSAAGKNNNGDITPAQMKATAYPNPFTDEITIELECRSNQQIKVWAIDIAGHALQPKSSISYADGKARIRIMASGMKPGHYTIKIITGGRPTAVSAIKI